MPLAPALSGVLAIHPVLDAVKRDQAAPRSAYPFEHLALGQKVIGQVLSQSRGISLVLIEGQSVAMRLPAPVTSGDTLKLSFAGHMPQPVFLLEPPETAAGNRPQLSQTARMLSDIMQRVPERALPTLTPPGPLLEQPTANAAALALVLRTALVRSGLFYESHLANWVGGEDNLDGLMQEPQNRLAMMEAARPAVSPGSALALSNTSEAAEQRPANPLHVLLTQQLQVLESPHLVWKGELWPGQPLEWQLRQGEDPALNQDGASAASEAEAGWTSEIRLTLPQLGTLTLHIRLDARQAFSITVVPEEAGIEPLLRQNQSHLLNQLSEAGCAVNTLTVKHDADA